MREEHRKLTGDMTVAEPLELWGAVSGNVRVVDGGKMYVRGAIYGNLIVDDGGRVHILGSVSGNLTVMAGAKVIHSGTLGGDAINRGGRLYIDDMATVVGKIKPKSGETLIDPSAKVNR